MIYYIEYIPPTDEDNAEHATIYNHFGNYEPNEVTKVEYYDYTEYTIEIEHSGPISEALAEGIRLITASIEDEKP